MVTKRPCLSLFTHSCWRQRMAIVGLRYVYTGSLTAKTTSLGSVTKSLKGSGHLLASHWVWQPSPAQNELTHPLDPPWELKGNLPSPRRFWVISPVQRKYLDFKAEWSLEMGLPTKELEGHLVVRMAGDQEEGKPERAWKWPECRWNFSKVLKFLGPVFLLLKWNHNINLTCFLEFNTVKEAPTIKDISVTNEALTE